MRLSDIKKALITLELELKEKECGAYSTYRREVMKLFKLHGIKKINAGFYSDVFSCDDFNYVIKIIKRPEISTFKKQYSELYLKPTYVSDNLFLVIQKKVPVLSDLMKKISDRYSDDGLHNIGLVDGKLVVIDLDTVYEYKTTKRK